MNNLYQFDRSLLTIDIPGAQPRKKSIQLNKMESLDTKQCRQLKLQQQSVIIMLTFRLNIAQQDQHYGRRRYQHDFHHFCNSFVPQGEYYFDVSQKKHYNLQEGEIKQMRALENIYDQPKLLTTNDIDGAMPGSLQSKVVKNMEKAQKLRLERDSQRALNNEALYLRPMMDCRLQMEKQPTRTKSFSMQQTPQNPLIDNQIIEINNLKQFNEMRKLPKIGENLPSIQNRVHKYSFVEGFDRESSILQKCQPMKVFV
ncbi:unnamed protein product (macronuclear) [Paramecium tetraurelia]|uniref:Uncharacterized protein n=1 Tax=Paramecium tetraurelia TaxID=5888 RepID=A0DI30_PARTE|nr:uncharacterized protein GSPATT00017068001 [Paramecium tetraurelia]CAK82697.1 unnamed protein product [Paramecium tetraurelia]|eukprot:XP_001450094.1 hypothetical protein (macronuclear) [Paramecium tetraurelia strain d4-2]